jgi:hypothetical protein
MESSSTPALSLPFGAVAGNELLSAFMEMYKSIPFIKANGEYNLTPSTLYHTQVFRELGLTKENKIQRIRGFSVYPTDVFSPMHPNLVYECFTENTHAIHHFAGTWKTDKENDGKIGVVLDFRQVMERLHGGGIYKISFNR